MNKGLNEMKRRHEVSNRRFILARNFAVNHGLRFEQVVHLCETGRISDARFDRILWNWVLYLPVKLLVR